MDADERWRVLRLHDEDQVPLAALARDRHRLTHSRTVASALPRGGVLALDRAPRTNAGQRRTDTAVVAFVERLALTRPRPSVATLHRLTIAEAERQGLPVPSYSTVRGTTRALDPALVTLALEGPASYRDKYELVYVWFQGRARQVDDDHNFEIRSVGQA